MYFVDDRAKEDLTKLKKYISSNDSGILKNTKQTVARYGILSHILKNINIFLYNNYLTKFSEKMFTDGDNLFINDHYFNELLKTSEKKEINLIIHALSEILNLNLGMGYKIKVVDKNEILNELAVNGINHPVGVLKYDATDNCLKVKLKEIISDVEDEFNSVGADLYYTKNIKELSVRINNIRTDI